MAVASKSSWPFFASLFCKRRGIKIFVAICVIVSCATAESGISRLKHSEGAFQALYAHTSENQTTSASSCPHCFRRFGPSNAYFRIDLSIDKLIKRENCEIVDWEVLECS
jgi:hypothetical protein